MAELRCEKCGKLINRKQDLVVTNRMLISFLTLHKDCFQQSLTEGDYFGSATNTTIANIAWLIITVIGVVYYVATRETIIFYILIFTILYRLYIWYRFERILD